MSFLSLSLGLEEQTSETFNRGIRNMGRGRGLQKVLASEGI